MLRTGRPAANSGRACGAICRAEALTRRIHGHSSRHQACLTERVRADPFLMRGNGAAAEIAPAHGRNPRAHAIVPRRFIHIRIAVAKPPAQRSEAVVKITSVIESDGIRSTAPSAIPRVIPVSRAGWKPAK